MERISSYSWPFQTQKQGQPPSCERKCQASMGWRWSQANVWKPFVRAALSEPCWEGRGGRGRLVLAACTTANLSQHEPAVLSMCPISIYCPSLQDQAGMEHPVGNRSQHYWCWQDHHSLKSCHHPQGKSVSPKPAGSSGKRREEVLQC